MERPQRKSKRRSKLISSTDAGNISKLRDGRFRIDYRDSRGNRARPAFATQEEAVATLDRIGAKKSSGEFFADSSPLSTRPAIFFSNATNAKAWP